MYFTLEDDRRQLATAKTHTTVTDDDFFATRKLQIAVASSYIGKSSKPSSTPTSNGQVGRWVRWQGDKILRLLEIVQSHRLYLKYSTFPQEIEDGNFAFARSVGP